MRRDLVIIGAGPAGLAAAAEARKAGLSTLVLDEQTAPGGQIYRQVERIARNEPDRMAALGPDYAHGLDLVREFRESGADHFPSTMVWQVEPGRAWYLKDDVVQSVIAKRILVATGAIERPMARPGWTLPGVMSAGAAQILLKSSGLLPTTDVVLMGNGPLLYLLATQLLKAGSTLQAIVETVPSKRYLHAAPHVVSALGAGLLGKGVKMLRDLRSGGVRIYRGAADLEMLGDQKVHAVRFRHSSGEVTLQTGTVLLHEGVIPNQQLTRVANCHHHWDRNQQCFVPDHDEWGNTSVEGIMVAGDGAGIGGALAAEVAGRLAALEAARSLGVISASDRDATAASLRRMNRRLIKARRFIEILYSPSDVSQTQDDTVVCRCEEITAGQIRDAVAIGNTGPNEVKSYLRCGMGPCQGRMCGPTISEIIARERRSKPADVGYFRIRPPVKPIPLTALANARIVEEELQ